MSGKAGGNTVAGGIAAKAPRPLSKKPRTQEPAPPQDSMVTHGRPRPDKGKGRATGPPFHEDTVLPHSNNATSSRTIPGKSGQGQVVAKRRVVSDRRTDLLPFESDLSEDEEGTIVKFDWNPYSHSMCPRPQTDGRD